MTIYNLISFVGIFLLMFTAWIFSNGKRNINWRVVFWAAALQIVFAVFIFHLPAGVFLFDQVNKVIIKVLSFAGEGMYFVFGPLSVPPGATGPHGEASPGFILVTQALPAVIFFSALMAILYHIGLMQKIVKAFTDIFTYFMKISGAEALSASSNIVVGVESVFTIRPYIEGMTKSELCTILTAGMATIASTVMAIYVGFLRVEFPSIAGHLVSASILSAPAAVAMSKLVYPENGHPETLGKPAPGHYLRSETWIEAVISGSQEGLKLVIGIVVLLLSFLGFLAMLNWFLSVGGHWIGKGLGISLDLSLQKILSFLYYPLTLIMGVPLKDISAVSILLGERTIVTELVSYQHLSGYIKSGVLTDPRSIIISAYALCGFAHIASLAIFVGGISALAPSRTKDLARLGFRALLAATLACLMTGAVAGVFVTAASNRMAGF